MRTPLIAANWKMNKLPSEAEGWANTLKERLTHVDNFENVDVVLCVPFTHLTSLHTILADSPVDLGAEDVSAFDSGAYTGEVSAAMLKDIGVSYVIIGHSERREYHAEDDELVHDKLKIALEHGLKPILCVGETLEQREADRAKEVVLGQLEADLQDLSIENADDFAVAYEPIWAIGTGETATADDAQEMCAEIRSALQDLLPELAEEVRILYGGSMKPANAAELLAQSDIDGGLVGGASLEVDSFVELIEAAK